MIDAGILTMLGTDGSVRVFESKQVAFDVLGYWFIESRVGPAFRPTFGQLRQVGMSDFPCSFDFILRDEAGTALTGVDFRDLHKADRKAKRNEPRVRYAPGDGPVPRTGRRRFHSRYFRNVRTHSAIKASALVLVSDGEPPVRPCRNQANLPTCWDDVFRCTERSWKSHRATQWKSR